MNRRSSSHLKAARAAWLLAGAREARTPSSGRRGARACLAALGCAVLSTLSLPLPSYAASDTPATQASTAEEPPVATSRQEANRPESGDPAARGAPWSVWADAVAFDRVGTAQRKLVERVPGGTEFNSIPSTPGRTALKSTDLNQGFAAGMEVGAGYRIDSSHEVSASFFHVGDWDAKRSVGPDNPPDWLVMRAPGNFFQTQDFTYQSMTWDYTSGLYNAELNVRDELSKRLAVLAGVRWLQENEHLQGTIPPADRIWPLWKLDGNSTISDVEKYETRHGLPAPPFPPFWTTDTTNNLLGLQVGAEGKLIDLGPFCLNGTIKAGGYWNHASQSTVVSIDKILYNAGARADRFAFVGEAGLHCK